jgi:hypothetical protein
MQAFTDARGEDTADEIWFVEHPAVFTLGLSADRAHVLRADDIPVVQIDRGVRIWNVLDGTHRDYFVPDDFRRMRRLIGMTPAHLYVVADHAQGLLRFEVE